MQNPVNRLARGPLRQGPQSRVCIRIPPVLGGIALREARVDSGIPVGDLWPQPGQWTWRGKNRARFVYGTEQLEDRVDLGEGSAGEEDPRELVDVC